MTGQTISIAHYISTLSFDVAECVFRVMNTSIMGTPCDNFFYMKIWGPSNNCASEPLKASSGTGQHGPAWKCVYPKKKLTKNARITEI